MNEVSVPSSGWEYLCKNCIAHGNEHSARYSARARWGVHGYEYDNVHGNVLGNVYGNVHDNVHSNMNGKMNGNVHATR